MHILIQACIFSFCSLLLPTYLPSNVGGWGEEDEPRSEQRLGNPAQGQIPVLTCLDIDPLYP